VFRKVVAIGVIAFCIALFASEVLDNFDSALFQPLSSKSATARLGDLTLAVDASDESGATPGSAALSPPISHESISDTFVGCLGEEAADLRARGFKTYILKRSILI